MMYREPLKIYSHEIIEYDRKSRTDDDPLLSVEEVLETHSKILDEYAERHFGEPIPKKNKYQEIGSGESIDSRPEMLKVLKAIESPAIKAVIVVDVQRLSRGDLEDAGRLIKLLRYSNTYVITPQKTYDLRDEYDRDAFERELKRGNEYLEYFKKIQRRGKLASVAEGNYVGSVAPYGFTRKPIHNGKRECYTLEEKKDEADVVRMIFHWYCNEDIGAKAICRRLEAMGVRTKNQGYKWETSIIFSMLENVHYIGCVRWNWRKVVKVIEDQEVKMLRPKAKVDEYLIFKGKHDPIISEELFNKAQEIRGSKPRPKLDLTLKNPFSGIMFCKCGAKIGYNTYTKNGVEFAPPKLKCNNQARCKNGSADFQTVMERICEILRDCISDFEIRIHDKQDDSIKMHKSLIDGLEKKLKKLEAEELAQWKAQTHPDESQRMPQHIFQKLNEELLKNKQEINDALCKAKEVLPTPVDYKDRLVRFTEALEALENPNIPAKIKNQYLRNAVERIDYERPQITRLKKQKVKGLQYHIEPFKIRITIK